eukprot:Nk52_evm30s1992 gene=Nk52_evmTU30s1992
MSWLCAGISNFLSGRKQDLYGRQWFGEDEESASERLLLLLRNREETDFLQGEPLHVLRTLSFSDSVHVQRSAAFTFLEVTERHLNAIFPEEALEPIIYLAHSSDLDTIRAISKALSNISFVDTNKISLMDLGVMAPMVRLLDCSDYEVKFNCSACVTNLAASPLCAGNIARAGAIPPLVRLSRSLYTKLQRNAVGALLNLSKLEQHRLLLLGGGVIDSFMDLLHVHENDIIYFTLCALTNLCCSTDVIKEVFRMEDGLQSLKGLLEHDSQRIVVQTLFLLRNLSSDPSGRKVIVQENFIGCVASVILHNPSPDALKAALSCIRNMSIESTAHPVVLQNRELFCELCSYLTHQDPHVQSHSVKIFSFLFENANGVLARLKEYELGPSFKKDLMQSLRMYEQVSCDEEVIFDLLKVVRGVGLDDISSGADMGNAGFENESLYAEMLVGVLKRIRESSSTHLQSACNDVIQTLEFDDSETPGSS